MSQKKKGWRCVGCGMRLRQELAPAARAAAKALRAEKGVLHVCGKCKCLMVEDGKGSLRELTVAEKFEFYAEQPNAARTIEVGVFPTEGGATLLVQPN